MNLFRLNHMTGISIRGLIMLTKFHFHSLNSTIFFKKLCMSFGNDSNLTQNVKFTLWSNLNLYRINVDLL
jgi:hypothetical protein